VLRDCDRLRMTWNFTHLYSFIMDIILNSDGGYRNVSMQIPFQCSICTCHMDSTSYKNHMQGLGICCIGQASWE
jgi:hypothetical protein